MRKILIRFFLGMALLIIPTTTLAKNSMIGISPFQEAKAAEVQAKIILQFLTTTLEPGDSAMLFDAYHIQTLGHFVVPNNSAYRHPKAKIQANTKAVRSLLNFAKQAKKPRGTDEPSVVGAIRLPQALRFIGENFPAEKKSDLILLGNPLHDDPKDKVYTMRNYRIPGDGHLTHTRNATPYGIKGQETLLAKWRVHLGFADESWARDENHSFSVQRLWTLFVEKQGGRLSTFTSDLPTLFQRVQTGASSPKHSYELQTSDKLEMLILRKPRVRNQLPIYERPITKTPLATELLRQASNVEVGLTWDCSWCDLDLYVRPGHAAQTLSFQTMQSDDGQYFKDWQRSPRATNGYETVILNGTVDMTTLFLAVNIYGGRTSGGVHGELRISLDGQTYASAFHLKARMGNVGAEREHVMETGQVPSNHWVVIDPMKVIGLQENRQALVKE